MDEAMVPRLWISLRQLASAGVIGCTAAIIVYGADVLGTYGQVAKGCKLENKHDSDHIVKYTDYVQLLGPVGITASLLFHSIAEFFVPKSPSSMMMKTAYKLAGTVLMHLVVISSFMTLYGILTTQCDGNDADARNETDSVHIVSWLFLGVMIALGLNAHEFVFGPVNDDGKHDEQKLHNNVITHFAALLECVLLVSGFAYAMRVLDKDTTYTPLCRYVLSTNPVVNTTNGVDYVDGTDVSGYHTYDDRLNPVENDHIKNMIRSGIAFASIQLAIRLAEVFRLYHGVMGDDAKRLEDLEVDDVQIPMISYFARVCSLLTRLIAGVFICGMIISHRVEGCEPYTVDTDVKNAAGLLLGVLFPSVLHLQSAHFGNTAYGYNSLTARFLG